MNCKRFVLLVLMLLLAAICVPAQTFRGTVLGTVTDTSGAVVSGATVKVRNVDTGLERTTQTSADGTYSAPELPFGNYTVTVSQSGFQTSVTSDVAVDVASERRVDVVLEAGRGGRAGRGDRRELPQVDTTSAELGGILTSQTIENIPVNGRDYTKLIYLNPGVAGSPDQISDSPGSFGEFSMNGSRGRSNNYLLDGTDMNDGYRNDPAINEAGVFGDPATILPIDAVGELHVLSNYEAEYGRNSGAIVNIVTKSGTNQWHGSALEYYRSGAFGARNYFNIGRPAQEPFHEQPVRRLAGRSDRQRQGLLLLRLRRSAGERRASRLELRARPTLIRRKTIAPPDGQPSASRCSTCWRAIPGRRPTSRGDGQRGRNLQSRSANAAPTTWRPRPDFSTTWTA